MTNCLLFDETGSEDESDIENSICHIKTLIQSFYVTNQ